MNAGRVAWFLSLAGGLLATAGLSACGDRGDGEATASARPDILIFLVDTLRPDHLGHYGYERDSDPRLRAFAEDAVTFERAYAPSSWTKPSTASLLTGLDPLQHGAITGADRIDPQAKMLGEMLGERGYVTQAYSANPNVLDVWGFDRGFDRFVDLHAVKRTDVDAGDFLELLRQGGFAGEADAPRFHYLHTVDPHQPYGPPPEHRDAWPYESDLVRKPVQIDVELSSAELEATVDAYDGEIRYSDRVFGELLDDLRREGRYEETLIVYASDHGEEFLDHGRGGHQRTLFEEVVRVPLLIKFPANAFAGRRVEERVSLMDVVPTILGRVGSAETSGLEGIDLWKLLATNSKIERPFFFDLDREARPGRPNYTMQAVVAGKYKLIRAKSPQTETVLFDLEGDPRETKDLAAEQPEVVVRLGAVLDQWSSRAAEGFHLVVTNEDDRRERMFRGTLETDGRFLDVRRRGLESGDEAVLGDDGRSLRFDFTVMNQPNPSSPPPKFLIDQDGLSFRLEPEGAQLTVIGFEAEKEPAFLYGAELRPAQAFPKSFEAAKTVVDAPPSLLRALMSTAPGAPGRGCAVLLRVVRGETVEVDEELQERLRALGYGGDGR